MSNKKPRYPIREYLGQFEAWLLVMYRSNTFRKYDRTLERFFSTFPKYTGIEQFTSVDIADYKLIREQSGAAKSSIYLELNQLHIFWRWLIMDKGLSISNPARAFKNNYKARHTRKSNLSLTDLNSLLSECSVPYKRIVLNVIQGVPCPRKARKEIRDAAARAGLADFQLYELRLVVMRRLSREIVQTY